jgi:broad specificity phosphatase PhoE
VDELAWLGVARHGQSDGNVAAERAEADGAETVDLPAGGADVRLTPTGRAQAAAIGRWMASLPAARRPQLVVTSPHPRARQTAELAVAAAGTLAPPRVDDRLRDREQGTLALLTSRGLAVRLPEEAERKQRLGKFHYRPPGGESWTDMTVRLREVLDELRRECPGKRVLLVSHESVIFLFRYLIEGVSQERMLELVRSTALGNAALSSWCYRDGRLRPERFNSVEHLRVCGVPLTQQGNAGLQRSPAGHT